MPPCISDKCPTSASATPSGGAVRSNGAESPTVVASGLHGSGWATAEHGRLQSGPGTTQERVHGRQGAPHGGPPQVALAYPNHGDRCGAPSVSRGGATQYPWRARGSPLSAPRLVSVRGPDPQSGV